MHAACTLADYGEAIRLDSDDSRGYNECGVAHLHAGFAEFGTRGAMKKMAGLSTESETLPQAIIRDRDTFYGDAGMTSARTLGRS